MKSEIKIMIVEDESIIARSEKQSLEELGYTVSAKVVSGEEAVKKAKEAHDEELFRRGKKAQLPIFCGVSLRQAPFPWSLL